MFIHIGDEQVIQSKDVIGIIDYSIVTSSTINLEMLEELKGKQQIVVSDEELTKAVVITADKVYYSPLSVLTLKKRASMISTISRLEDYSENGEE
ncbi:extracellular matrix regulator RemB [Gracilibacillus sp. HCP3S3_G5_1]|uniref:extracellular matrix regulator RemB n=1 Tax=unclassified Gracilibacillus TaxID=2625209 RepID=UPI003F8C7A7F